MQQWLVQINPTAVTAMSLPQTMPTLFERAAGKKKNFKKKIHQLLLLQNQLKIASLFSQKKDTLK